MELPARDLRDLLRSVGGLLLAVGALALWARKSSHDGWSDLARLLVVAVPAILLFVLALDLSEPRAREKARPSQSVLMVVSILLGPVVLFEFLHGIGASTRHALLDAAVFAIVALLAVYATWRTRVSYTALLAGLGAIISLALVWIGSRARFRGLGYVGGVGLLAFLVSIVAQITRIEVGRAPTASVAGWPLSLLLLGAAALAASANPLHDKQAPPPPLAPPPPPVPPPLTPP